MRRSLCLQLLVLAAAITVAFSLPISAAADPQTPAKGSKTSGKKANTQKPNDNKAGNANSGKPSGSIPKKPGNPKPAGNNKPDQKKNDPANNQQAPGQAPPKQAPPNTPLPDGQPLSPDDQAVIKPGLSVGGVDIGGLTVTAATAKLNQHLTRPLSRNIRVKAGRTYYRLPTQDIGFQLDALRSARRAFNFGQTIPDPTAQINIPAAVTYQNAALDRFVNEIARNTYKAPVDAKVKIEVHRIVRSYAKHGQALNTPELKKTIATALEDTTAPRDLTAPTTRLSPKVKYKDLPRLNPTIITVDRRNFRLRFFKNLRLTKTYSVAVGQSSYPTPAGRFRITDKTVNPAWTAPKKDWAGSYAGKTVPGGSPENPLKARWLGIGNGVGIHGTGSVGSIGSSASHGCIRMTVPDVIDLYNRTPVGTPVIIK